MPKSSLLGRGLLVAGLLGAAFVAVPSSLVASDSKVKDGDTIKKKLQPLYNGEVAAENGADREKVFVEVEKVLTKDKTGSALRKPDFWVDAVQESRFAGNKRKFGKNKAVFSEDIPVPTRDDKPDAQPKKAKMWYRAGGLVTASKPAPLLVAILEKDADCKAYIEATWAANEEIAKDWIIVAMAESPEFPISKDAGVIAMPFAEIRDRFNTDANRWFLEAVGNSCVPVQRATTMFLSHRLAGMILRGPASPVTNANSAMCSTLVVHGATSAPGKLVAEAYKKIDEKANSSVEVADLPAVTALNDQVIAWVTQHGKRTVPASSTFVTTLTGSDGETWTGTMNIVSPGKYGQPTTVTTTYLRDSNTIDIKCENLGEFYVYMNDDLLDLDKPVAIFVNGQQLAKKTFERDIRNMFYNADTYGEWGRMFPASYRGLVPTKIAPPAAPVPAPDPNAPPTDKPAPTPAPTDKPPPAPTEPPK